MNKLHSHYMTTCYHFRQRSLDECSIHSVILVLKTQPYSKKKKKIIIIKILLRIPKNYTCSWVPTNIEDTVYYKNCTTPLVNSF